MCEIIKHQPLFEMLKEPIATTKEFHEVLMQLRLLGLLPGNADLELFIDDLLHPPRLPEDWRVTAEDLASNGLIATVTDNEAHGMIHEAPQDVPGWDELAARVIDHRVGETSIIIDVSYGDYALAIEPE